MNKDIYNLTSMSKNELINLSNDKLCERMEAVLYKILCESFTDPRAIDLFPRQSIQDFFNTEQIKSLPQTHQRSALRKCFEYLVQHEYLSRMSRWLNQAVYDVNYDESKSWLSPKIQSIQCAVNQSNIVGSGIACDRMMDLLHIIETGESIEGNSKFKSFRKWLLRSQNKFVFFAPNLPRIHKFRSSLRTAEAHEWSSQPDKLLQLQQPSFEDSNDPLKLVNILNWMWSPLLELLNNRLPTSTAGSGAGIEWVTAIQNNDIDYIEAELKRLHSEIVDQQAKK